MISITQTDQQIAAIDATAIVAKCENFDRASERIAVSIIKLIGWIGVVFLALYGLAKLIAGG